MTTIGILFVCFRYPLIELMAPGSALHAHLSAPLLIVSAFTQPFFATCIILKTSMRGAGATNAVMRWSFGSMFFYRVGVLWWFFHHGGISLTQVWIVLGLDLFTQSIAFSWLHFRGAVAERKGLRTAQRFSQRQSRPSSESRASPARTNPPCSSTRAEAFRSGKV